MRRTRAKYSPARVAFTNARKKIYEMQLTVDATVRALHTLEVANKNLREENKRLKECK